MYLNCTILLYSTLTILTNLGMIKETPGVFSIISKSLSFNFLTAVAPGGPNPVLALDIVRIFVDNEVNCPVIAVFKPEPSEINETTAAMPKKIPNIVSQDLIPLFLTFLNANTK